MKNSILSFLLGVFVVISIAASTNTITVFKLLNYKKVKVKEISAYGDQISALSYYIKTNAKYGYHLESITALNVSAYNSRLIVVLVKY